MSSSFPPAGTVRIGDRERDQATECLREHMASGRLDQDEFEQRIEVALSARYADDLRPLFVDLPAPRPDLPTFRPEPFAHRVATEPVVRSTSAAPARSLASWRVATAVVWTVAIIVAIASGWHLWFLLFVPFVMGGGCGGRRSREAHQRRLADRQMGWDARERDFQTRVRRFEQRHW